eukprot:gb/GECG01012036.1/.p1 GENE.gb/GECG01012036.1/~~gb/GECG01012036.1/.p1  ORF type:complete len:427 (+),score=87.23 gb/GECG01012036.1/:1-1281(+)
MDHRDTGTNWNGIVNLQPASLLQTSSKRIRMASEENTYSRGGGGQREEEVRESSLSPPPPPVSPPRTPEELSSSSSSTGKQANGETQPEGRYSKDGGYSTNGEETPNFGAQDITSVTTASRTEWWEKDDFLNEESLFESVQASRANGATTSETQQMSSSNPYHKTSVASQQHTNKPKIDVDTAAANHSSPHRPHRPDVSQLVHYQRPHHHRPEEEHDRKEQRHHLVEHHYDDDSSLTGLQREMRVRLETLINTVRTVGLKRGQEATVLDRIADISETYASTVRAWEKHDDELQKRNEKLASQTKKQSLEIQELQSKVLDAQLRAERADNTLKMEQEDMEYQLRCKDQTLEAQKERQRLQEHQWKSEIERQVQERFHRRFNELKRKLASKYDERVEATVQKLEQEFKAQLKTNGSPEQEYDHHGEVS